MLPLRICFLRWSQVGGYMGKNRGSNGPSAAARARNQAVSLREESSGKTHADVTSMLRVQHLQRLAVWAGGEAGVGPVGALLGRRLAANAEAAGIPLGASTFLCQRCETVLQPGFNCTIRIKSNKKKAKRRKKSNSCQNSVGFGCHFCGDQNLIRGSGKGIVKSLLSSRQPGGTDSTSMMSKGDSRNTRTVTITEGLEHSQAAVSQVKSSSRLKQSTLENDEHGERPKPNLSEVCKAEERLVSSMVESGQLAAGTSQEDVAQKIVVEITNEKYFHGTEPVSSEKIKICESDVTLQSEIPIGSKFVTPQKNKLTDVTDPKDSAALFKTKSMQNKKGDNSGSVTGKASASCSKSAPNDSGKNTKSAASGSAQVAGSSRKRARKGWTTLKQIAEKDELERKEKMADFVIPFFMH